MGVRQEGGRVREAEGESLCPTSPTECKLYIPKFLGSNVTPPSGAGGGGGSEVSQRLERGEGRPPGLFIVPQSSSPITRPASFLTPRMI